MPDRFVVALASGNDSADDAPASAAPGTTFGSRVSARLSRPVAIDSLVAFRIAYGAITAWASLRYFLNGWIEELFVRPRVYLPFFDWAVPLPGAAMYGLFAVLLGLSLCIALGYRYRLAVAAFFVGFTYLQLVDRANYLNHYYLISLVALLLLVVPAHRSCSLDVRARRVARATAVPAWCVWLLRFQVGLVYVFGAIAKLNQDWLCAAQPVRIWLGANVDLPLIGSLLQSAEVAFVVAYAGLLFDLAVVPGLLVRRTRPLAYAAMLVFHVSTRALFPIGVFPWLMIGLTPIFFAPSWPRRWTGAAPAETELVADPWPRGRRLGAALLLVYAVLQLSLPLRHWLQPGDLYWHEDGFRFSWQIMVMEKYGRISFTVTDPATGRKFAVNPSDHLQPAQLRMMTTQPDMILDFAHRIGRRYREQLGRPVEVRATSFVSLNGRPSQPFVDPGVDLMRVDSSQPRPQWIAPLNR